MPSFRTATPASLQSNPVVIPAARLLDPAPTASFSINVISARPAAAAARWYAALRPMTPPPTMTTFRSATFRFHSLGRASRLETHFVEHGRAAAVRRLQHCAILNGLVVVWDFQIGIAVGECGLLPFRVLE